jgi:hypothetical protein
MPSHPVSKSIQKRAKKPKNLGYLFSLISRPLKAACAVQLGFDRQHFTLPVPASFFGLNKGLPDRNQANRQIRF